RKWLKAGVLEDGIVSISEQGTAQGAVISPLLANIYLHYALDLWAERYRRREATGDMIIVRYADDFIVGFEHEHDARRFLDALRGKFLIKRKSRSDRMRAKVQAIKQELRRRMHQPIPIQGKWLGQVVRGYFNYHAVPTNSRAVEGFHDEVVRNWWRTLRRRSQRQALGWERMKQLADAWLPKPEILHPWPNQRFAVRYSR